MILKSSSIAALINEVYDGVERSKIGKIIHRTSENGDPVYTNLPFQTYLEVLRAVLPKNIDFNMKEES